MSDRRDDIKDEISCIKQRYLPLDIKPISLSDPPIKPNIERHQQPNQLTENVRFINIPSYQQVFTPIPNYQITKPQINVGVIPTPSPLNIVIPIYNRIGLTPNQPNIPPPMQEPSIPNPDYNSLKKQFKNHLFMSVLLSTEFPPLPIFQDILIPDLDLSEFDINLELDFFDIENLTAINSLGQSPYLSLTGGYLRNFGYINNYVENLYNSERIFLKKLFDKISDFEITYLPLLLAYVDIYLQKESNNFTKYFSRKQIQLLKSIVAYKFGKERLKTALQKYKLMIEKDILELLKISQQNEILFKNWQTFVKVNFENYKNYLKTIQRNTSLYKYANIINKNILNLFDYWMQLKLLATEVTVLNIQNSRLVLENHISNLYYSFVRQKENILPPIWQQNLQILNSLYPQLINLINEQKVFLMDKANFLKDKKHTALQEQLNSISTKLNNLKDKANVDIEEVYYKSDLQMHEEILSAYKQLWNEYLQMLEKWNNLNRNVLRADTEEEIYKTQIKIFLEKYEKLYETRMSWLADAYNRYVYWHETSSTILKNAQILSEIIESYQ